MFCRNCGQKLEEGDKFCSSCGAKTTPEDGGHITEDFGIHIGDSPSSDGKPAYEPFDFSTINFGFDLDVSANSAQAEAEAEEEAKNKPIITPVEDFDWNIHTFPGMEAKKTEDIDFNWSMPLEEEKPEPKPEPPAETIIDTEIHISEPEAPAPKEELHKTEEKEEPEPETTVSSLEESLFGGLDNKTDEARKQSEEIDKFFTFHEKNEQFQKLLDQEYEKIKSGNILADEITTAAAASEEKFASRKPEDPMEELFAAEGIVKGYEPKPVETDVLERIDAAEAEKKAREESERLIAEAKAKEEEEARRKAEEEERAKEEARIKAEEEAARKRLEEEAKRAADARAAREAAEREEARAAMRALEEKNEKKRQEIEARIAEQAAQLQAASEEKIRQEAEARAKAEAERLAKEQEEAKARAKAKEEEERRKAEEERAKAEAKAAEEARLKEEAEARAKEEAERKAAQEAERIRREAEAKAAKEAEEREKARAAEEAAQAQAKKAEEDKQNHISEMVRARETFFGQGSLEDGGEEPQDGETQPVKTKAVDKAAILAGMATASEMVQRDRAFAAAEAAKEEAEKAAAEQTPESIELPDFLGHEETPEAPEEPAEEEAEATDLLDELQSAEEEAFEMPEASEQEQEAEEPVDVFSIDDLLGDEAFNQPEEEQQELRLEEEPVQTAEELHPEEFSLEAIEIEEEQQEEEPVQAEPETHTEEPFEFDGRYEEQQPEEPETAELPAEEPADMSMTGEVPLFEDEYEYEEEYTGGKGRVVLKICLIILILLLAIEIAGVVIKVTMPSSGAAKFIDQKLNQVIHLVTGDDTEYSVIAATEDIRQTPVEDKTQLIQMEMGKNKDGNIETIEYNADLKFDPEREYENSDINLTQNLADVTWYKDAANKQVYYDQAIVGTVIAYGSQRVNMANYKDASVLNLIQKNTDLYNEIKELGDKGTKETFKTLQIGEIRQAGSQYYVWVSEKVQSTQNGTSTDAKVYEMTPEGETMKMVAAYTA